MTDFNKIKKKDLLNNINFHFFQYEKKEIENILNMKKSELIKIMIDYNIEYIDDLKLKELILKIEEENKLKTKIFYNYFKYNVNINITDVYNKNIDELKLYIINNNITHEPVNDEFDDLMNMIKSMLIYYKKYINNNDIEYNLPNLLNLLKNNI